MDIDKQRQRIQQRAERSRQVDRSQCEELWVHRDDGRAMCAMINGELGWLMYLRHEGDAGFSSRNPAYQGPAEALRGYYLASGQYDEYPVSWALPAHDIRRALAEFETDGKPPRWITWHNNSGDGTAV